MSNNCVLKRTSEIPCNIVCLEQRQPNSFTEKIKPLKYAFILKEIWVFTAASARKASDNAVYKIFKNKF